MDSDHVIVLFLGLLLVGAAVALAYSSPAGLGGESDGFGGASLASFETTDAYCGDPNSTRGTAITEDVSDGEALVLNQSIPVPTNDTDVSASLEEFGPQRYVLTLTRETPDRTATATPTPDTETPTATPPNASATDSATATDADGRSTETAGGNETATDRPTAESTPTETPTTTGPTCHPHVRYNATVHVAQPNEYTVVVTYDGEFIAAHWRDGDDRGSYDTIPEPPEAEGGRNGTVTADE